MRLLEQWSDIVAQRPAPAAERWAQTMLMIFRGRQTDVRALYSTVVVDAMIRTACAFYAGGADGAGGANGFRPSLQSRLENVSNVDMSVLAQHCLLGSVEVARVVLGESQRRYQANTVNCWAFMTAAAKALSQWHWTLNRRGVQQSMVEELLQPILQVLQPSLRDALASIQDPATRPADWRPLFERCCEVVGYVAQHQLGGLVHCAAASVLHQVVQIMREVDTAQRDEDSWLVGVIALLCATHGDEERRQGSGVDWLLLTVAHCVPVWRSAFEIDDTVANAVFRCVAGADSGNPGYQRALLDVLMARRMSQLPNPLVFELHASIDQQWLDRHAIEQDDFQPERRRLVKF